LITVLTNCAEDFIGAPKSLSFLDRYSWNVPASRTVVRLKARVASSRTETYDLLMLCITY
jgi:hypothetical protein